MAGFRRKRTANASKPIRTVLRELGLSRQTRLKLRGVEQLAAVPDVLGRVSYIPVDSSSPLNIDPNDCVHGMTIFGIRTAGAFVVNVPRELNVHQRICVKDERGTASSSNITVQTA